MTKAVNNVLKANEKEKCFAYSKKNGKEFCTALTSSDCNGRECPFFKTREQYDIDIEKANRRLALISVASDIKKKNTR